MKAIVCQCLKYVDHIREQIQKSPIVSNNELAFQFHLSTQTVSKWENRDFVQDVSSRPFNIHYALSGIETALIVSIRKSAWIPLDEIYEMLLEQNKTIPPKSPSWYRQGWPPAITN